MGIGDRSNLSNQQSAGFSTADSSTSATLALPESISSSEPPAKSASPPVDFWAELGISDSVPVPSSAPEASRKGSLDEPKAWHWAELITGINCEEEASRDDENKQITVWLERSSGAASVDISTFPNVFQTTRFCGEVKAIESPLAFLRAVAEKVLSGEFSFLEAIDHIGRIFGWDENRLLKWRQGMENLAALQRWLPAFTQAYDYVTASFPLGIKKTDQLRVSLIESVEEPHRLLESNPRNEFETRFLEFKKNYMDSYFVLHEDALHAIGGLKKDEVKVDAVALRNLDLLSGLQHVDQSYLNRVKLFAKWIQHRQCNLPLHQILEHYPRCYCNFNPGSHRHPADYAVQINSIIQEGLEYIRTALRQCGPWIMPALTAQAVDSESRKQISTLLSGGPIISLKAQSIDILNEIIAGNSAEFLSEARKAADKPRG
jgi:hypothetical protein